MLYNVLSIMTLVLCFLLGMYVYSSDKKNPVNISFMFMIYSAMIWIFSNLMTDLSIDPQFILLWSKAAMVGPIFFSYFFFNMSRFFPTEKKSKYSQLHERIIFFILLVLLFLIPTHFNIESVSIKGDGLPEIVPGFLYIPALIFFAYMIVWGIRNLFFKYKALVRVEKLQVQYISIGIGLSVFLGSVTNVILPLFDISGYVSVGPYFLLIFVFFTSYAIIKFKMFDIKIIATQLIVFSLWIFVLLRTLVGPSLEDKLINAGLLVLLLVFGAFLIRSVMKEVRQRERIEKLATDLQKANDRLTDLDRQKSEFVSFATHQLRAPLTAMKGYASLILEGDMGAITDPVKEAVSRIFESTKTLASIVDDYLNITRIELGTMKYAFDTVDLKGMIEDVIAELGPNLKKEGLEFTFKAEEVGSEWDWRITADRDKLKQVIANIVDNSIKYTLKGFVHVTLSFDRTKHKFIFKVTDNGIGIAPETLPLLFQKFSRAGNANKTNIKGTGLGLFVAKQIVTAHHGDIWAASPGEGKGSTFVVELDPFSKA